MSGAKRIVVSAPGARDIFARWVSRGDAVGVFENHDLGHPGAGHLIFIPINEAEQEKVVVGQTKAPDGQHGLGWRYVLNALVTDVAAFDYIEEKY